MNKGQRMKVRQSGCESIKRGGTAGYDFIPVPARNCRDRIFLFWWRLYYDYFIDKTMAKLTLNL